MAPTPPQHPNPTEGGSYVRNADGSLTTVHQTEQITGRVKASREALDARLAGDDAVVDTRESNEE